MTGTQWLCDHFSRCDTNQTEMELMTLASCSWNVMLLSPEKVEEEHNSPLQTGSFYSTHILNVYLRPGRPQGNLSEQNREASCSSDTHTPLEGICQGCMACDLAHCLSW